MPIIGEIRKGREIEKTRTGQRGSYRYIWHSCIGCGKERWVQFTKKNGAISQRCRSCANLQSNSGGFRNLVLGRLGRKGSANPNWKGGALKERYPYILTRLYPNDFFYSMADRDGYVLEHRLVMAQSLGRCLHRWEIIHHKGKRYPLGSIENKHDNKIDNLMIIVAGNIIGQHTAKIKCPHCGSEFRVR